MWRHERPGHPVVPVVPVVVCHDRRVAGPLPSRTDPDAHEALRVLSAATGDDYRWVGPLVGGETGATEIRRADGARFVMKWETDPDNRQARRLGARLAERLRTEARWPAPRQQLVETDGCLVVVQEFMVGTVVDHLTHDLVDDLVALHEARLAMAPDPGASTWAEDMVTLLVEGGNGYCLHGPLRGHGADTRRVVERIEEIGRATRVDDLRGHDVVHADLHPGNLLGVDGRLTAVIDLDYACLGDAAFDLTMLAVSSLGVGADPGVRSRLFAAGVDALAAPRRRAYVANLLLRNLDWSIRGHRPAAIDFWLGEADRLLTVDD